ncbi:NADH-quinone oxidoreductase subunit NuoH [bacterium]|nr:NADH-quinone oxidoreductase subunit NuoH [bacterium]
MNYLYFWYVQLLAKYNIPKIFADITFPILPFCIIAGVMIVVVLILVLAERKILALFTQRKGPNRVGYFGLLQTVADAIKLLCKQNINPQGADKILFNLAPIIAFSPVLILWGLIPYSSEFEFMGFSISILLYLAIAAFPVIGIILAGYASNNKFSLIGAVRSGAQMITYEIPMIFVVLSVVALANSMNLKDIVLAQMNTNPIMGWYIFPCILGFLIMFICVIAELNRCPFDLPEAESELTAGYSTEYSGMRFALFYLGEYASLFVMSVFIATIFMGGFLPVTQNYISEMLFANNQFLQVFIYIEQVMWLLLKSSFLIFIIMLIRATLPRLSSKSLMNLSWYCLMPLSVINFIIIIVFKYITEGRM